MSPFVPFACITAAALSTLALGCTPEAREATVGSPVVTDADAPRAEGAPTPAGEVAPAEPTDAGGPAHGDGAPTPMLPSGARLAPERYRHVVLRVSHPLRTPFANVLYEGNNIVVRGPRHGPTYDEPGAEAARRWRRIARSVGQVFVLRDSLYSQQDHPTAQRPEALMMPPCWVTVAVAEVLAGGTPRPVQAPAAGDDAGWAAIPSAGAMFGSFPPSESLFRAAGRPLSGSSGRGRAEIGNARASVRSLAADAAAMIAAAPGGAEAVARAGAERIADSDRRYFGAEARRRHVVPIFVENPNRHELVDEGKGLEVAGRRLPPEALRITLRAVYGRRLEDGDLAIERYDVSRPAERARAVAVLEALVPASRPTTGGVVWLWVNGGLDERGIGGTDATAHIAALRAEVAAADVDASRVRYLSKPHVTLPSGVRRAPAFEAALHRYEALGLPLSVNFGGPALARLIDGSTDSPHAP